MTWNFRVMRHTNGVETWVSIHEVYNSEKTGKPNAFAVHGVGVCSTEVELKLYVERMLQALDKVTLVPEDFSSAISEKADESS